MSNQPPKQGLLQASLNRAAQYAKDVVTLQIAKDNFFRDDGTFDEWFAHGASETANMVLHGQTATIYGGSSSPPFQSPDSNALSMEPVIEPLDTSSTEITPAASYSPDHSILSGLVERAEQAAQIQTPELEYEQ